MKYLSLFLILLGLCSCEENSKENKTTSTTDSTSVNIVINKYAPSPCEQMDSVLNLMDSLKAAEYSIENDELVAKYSSRLNGLAIDCSEYYANKGTYKPEKFKVCWSADSALGIISWDMRMGGTFVNVEHIKFSQGLNSTIFYKSTDREKKGDGDINATAYSKIARLPIPGKDIYICHGTGKTSNPTFYYSLDVVEVSKAITPANIFPEAQSSISIQYDMMEIYGDIEVLDFIVSPDGTIQIPEMKGYSIPSGKYITWKLKNGVYKRVEAYEAFIPPGYSILEMQEGQIYQGGSEKNDIVMILRDTLELHDDIWDLPRPLIVLRATKDGYELAARADHVVMCQDCGGVFGDPFDYLTVSTETIEVGHYGGSSDRWYERYTFQLDEGGNYWELTKIVNGGHSVFDEDGDGEVDLFEETIETNEDFGLIRMEDFGKESEN